MSNNPDNTPRTVRVLMRGNACTSCRRRKQRCDGTRPVCQQCIRFNRVSECVFEQRPRTQAEMLEDRVRELENMIAEAQALREDGSQQANRKQGGGDGGLPRPDIALISTPIGTEPSGDPPAEITEHLLQAFFKHLYQFNFGLDINKFRFSLTLPSSSSSAPHPALLNAIYLVACLFASPPPNGGGNLERFERIFMNRAQRHLDDALAHVDRLLDFLMATTLLAQYNLIKGNVSKGSYLASSAMSFAVGCGMHKISLDPSDNQFVPTILPPPASEADIIDRINVFSSVFQVERRAIIESGAPTAVLDKDIVTPWPHTAGNMDNATISSLYELENGSTISTQREIPLAIRAKTMALFDRATRLARHASFVFQRPLHASSDTLFWDSYHALDYALVGFRNSLPPLSSLPSPQAPGRRAVGSSGSDSGSSYSTPPAAYEAEERGHTLLFAHIASLTAVMHVHDIFANRDESERWIVLRAAGDVVATVHTAVSRPGMCLPGACVLDPRKTHMLIGVGLAMSARVLLRERARIVALGSGLVAPSVDLGAGPSSAVEIEDSSDPDVMASEAEFMIKCLRSLMTFYPGLRAHLTEVEVLAAASASASPQSGVI